MFWTVWNKIDADLVSAKIKEWVNIFWVSWNYEWNIVWSNWNYIWSISYSNLISVSSRAVRAIELWDYVYFFSCYWITGWGMWLICSKINKNTLAISVIWFKSQGGSWAGSHYITNCYVDWTWIYINFTNGWAWSEYIKLETSTDTLTWSTGNYTTWVIDNSTSKVIWSKTYTPYADEATNSLDASSHCIVSFIGIT